MRTTIELPDDLRARLLEIAARRGEKGCSGLVREAVARYVADLDSRSAQVAKASKVLGTLSRRDAEATCSLTPCTAGILTSASPALNSARSLSVPYRNSIPRIAVRRP